MNLTNDFSLKENDHIKLVIYDITGRLVRTLLSGYYARDHYSIVWNSKDNSGVKVNSGIYIYQLQTSNVVLTKKMALIK